MRLWSLHPSQLDRIGIIAAWREGLLAQNALIKRKGYYNHSQLIRFKQTDNPLLNLSSYLHVLCDEAERRSYNFKRAKIACRPITHSQPISLTTGQLQYEKELLQRKFLTRKVPHSTIVNAVAHPIFELVEGPVEKWEKRKF